MKKQELIHVHGVLAQVRNYYEREEGSEIDTSRYEDVGVQSTSIHKSKSEHKEAVSALGACIIADMADEDAQQVPVSAD